MFKKILYVSLFVLIFLLAVQSVSASDTNLNDINFNNIGSNDISTNDIVLEDGEGSSDTDEIEVESDSEKSVGGESSDTNPNDSGADSTIEELEDDENPDEHDEPNVEEELGESLINANPITFDYASEGELEISLVDSDGSALSNKTISVKVNGTEENLTTDDNGIAIFKFSGDVGTYDVNISFDGDGSYAPSSASTTLTITKSSTKINVKNLRSYLTCPTYINLTLVDSKGRAIANKNVTVTVSGKSYKTVTNSKGIAQVEIPNKIGNFTVSVEFEGDKNYLNSSASSTLEITKMKTSIVSPNVKSYMAYNTYLTITLKNVYGDVLSNKPITVKVNKKTYNLTTDSKGVAKLKFDKKVGTYKCTIKFKETGTYYGASKSSQVVITKTPVTISAPSSIKINSKKYAKILITLKDVKGKLLKNKTLTITIQSNKKKYTVKTNSEGAVTFRFNGPKSNNLTIKYAGSKKTYNSKSLKVKIKVTPIKVKFNDVVGAANKLLKHISKNKALPSYIVYNEKNFTTAELSYLMAVAIKHIDKKNRNDIVLIAVSTPKNSTGEIYDTVYKKNYLKIANKAMGSSIRHSTPAYIKHSFYKVPYKVYTAEFSRALSFYKSNKRLPKYVLFTNSEFVKVSNSSKYTFYLTTDNIAGKKKDLKMLKKLRAALKSKGYNAVIIGIGPDIHNIAYRYGCTGKDSVLLACFGGVDVGCIEEWTGELQNSNRNFVKNYDGAHILGLWYTKPYGASSNIHKRIGRAWDANYGHPLKNPAKYMEKHNISYIQTGKVTTACNLLKAGKMGGPKLIE